MLILCFKFRMEVFNLTEPVPLMCHLSDGEDYIILPTNSISGNKLSTWVACPEYKLSRAAEYRITVVYSTDAIDAMLKYTISYYILYEYLTYIIHLIFVNIKKTHEFDSCKNYDK